MLDKLTNNIRVGLRKLNTICANGKTATIGGGTLQWEATQALGPAKEQAAICLYKCVSIAEHFLGGSYSYLPGSCFHFDVYLTLNALVSSLAFLVTARNIITPSSTGINANSTIP